MKNYFAAVSDCASRAVAKYINIITLTLFLIIITLPPSPAPPLIIIIIIITNTIVTSAAVSDCASRGGAGYIGD